MRWKSSTLDDPKGHYWQPVRSPILATAGLIVNCMIKLDPNSVGNYFACRLAAFQFADRGSNMVYISIAKSFFRCKHILTYRTVFVSVIVGKSASFVNRMKCRHKQWPAPMKSVIVVDSNAVIVLFARMLAVMNIPVFFKEKKLITTNNFHVVVWNPSMAETCTVDRKYISNATAW